MERVRFGVIGLGLFGERQVAALRALPLVERAAVPDWQVPPAPFPDLAWGVVEFTTHWLLPGASGLGLGDTLPSGRRAREGGPGPDLSWRGAVPARRAPGVGCVV